jgi:predicted O-methyltransferase YrrM
MSLAKFLLNRGYYEFEGYSQQVPKQVEDLIALSNGPDKLNVMEIGFNAGHSAEVFLQNNKHLKLTSFDLGEHDYVHVAKEYIDTTYPNRHTLILGDSTITVPAYTCDTKFDVIFIDGGHDYEIAKADIDNCRRLAHENTIVILDDTAYTQGWQVGYTIGPTQTWTEHVNDSTICELHRKDYCYGRGMSWGLYKK